MDKISIIVPIYNVAEYLPKCVESICGQTYSNIEIILVNDGSTDECADILKYYSSQDNRIKVLTQENQGANVARNNGLKHAVGEWVCFVDGDDWIDQNMCKELIQCSEPDLDILFYSYRYVYPTYCKEFLYTDTSFYIKKEDFRELQYATLNRLGPYRFGIHKMDPVSVWDKMYRLQFLKENQLLFNEELPKLQDLLFNLNVYNYAKKGYTINKSFYNYRMNDKSVSRRYQENIVDKFNIIHRHLKLFIEQYEDDDIMRQSYYERIATHFRTCVVLNFCNKNNNKSYKDRKKDFLKVYENEVFKEAMDKVKLENFTLRERVLSKCIKIKWFGACELLYRLNCLLEKIKVNR